MRSSWPYRCIAQPRRSQNMNYMAFHSRCAGRLFPSQATSLKAGRNTDKEFRQFLFNARGSLLELETQLLIAHELSYLAKHTYFDLRNATKDVGRSLAGLLNSLAVAA